MAERNAPLGKYREPLIPPYPVNDSWVNREEWLDDIKYCLKQGYVWCHECIEEEKVLGVIGERNVYGVERMITTSLLTKDYVMYGSMDSVNIPGTS